MRLVLLLPLVAGLGCAGTPDPPDLEWLSLDAAFERAKTSEKPVLVLSLLGDIRKRC